MAILFLSISFSTLQTSSSKVPGFDAQHAVPAIDLAGPRSADPAGAPAGQDAAVPRPALEDGAGAASGSPDSYLLRFRS
ncbi:MAG TPA: hypothetical protein VN493_15840 [Thermoanaerobaculia bacterium]|nr:hypothetical protein [Thermoanaerobaculia bacterium]